VIAIMEDDDTYKCSILLNDGVFMNMASTAESFSPERARFEIKIVIFFKISLA
jgi:hypothetical protein